MKLGDVEFDGFVMNASGARGFFGEEYPLPHPGFLANWDGSIFVSKTTTLEPRTGFMPMRTDGVTPKERIPRCIIVKPWDGHVLNCVGLSGPGVRALLEEGEWQQRKEPFVISFMAEGETRNDRMLQWYQFVTLMSRVKPTFHSPFAVEINIACPNVDHDAKELVSEVSHMLDVGSPLEAPLIVCINLLVSPHEAFEISRHPHCAAVSQSNSIPWGAFPDFIPWGRIFGSSTSPLIARGFKAGGYSGPYALPPLLRWLGEARYIRGCSASRWLIVGGGIQCVDDALMVRRAGYPFILGLKIGVVTLVRPLNVQPIIRAINNDFRYSDKTVYRKEYA